MKHVEQRYRTKWACYGCGNLDEPTFFTLVLGIQRPLCYACELTYAAAEQACRRRGELLETLDRRPKHSKNRAKVNEQQKIKRI